MACDHLRRDNPSRHYTSRNNTSRHNNASRHPRLVLPVVGLLVDLMDW